MNSIIELEHLSKYYGKSRGIEDISFHVSRGDIFGFIGPNGAGKSTTIRILLNLIFPSSGVGKIFGLDMVRESKNIRSRIGFVPSDANLYDRMKVHEFLKYGAELYGVLDFEQRTKELAGLFDLDMERKLTELSTGNRKKVFIIQALVHRPELLILDEPTTGLDPLIQSRFFDLLHEENNRGTTIFFSSHNLNEVQNFCRSVAIIREGKIINVDTVDSLRKKQLKKIRVIFAEDNRFRETGLKGINWIGKPEGKEIEFYFSGNMNDLLELLSVHKIENLVIEEPPLDEIFLHYYRYGGSEQ
jgi:ABC-2 type transport system ATP-binding protein